MKVGHYDLAPTIMKIKKFIMKKEIRFAYLSALGFYNHVSDRQYLEKKWKYIMGYEINLDHPHTFNEKLQWLKLHDRREEYTSMVDKYEVKNLIRQLFGAEYVIPNIGLWDCVDQINFDFLPNQFVLKCTHDSGGVVICREKNALDRKIVCKKLRRHLKRNFFWQAREWPYKGVLPRVICEKYIEEMGSGSLIDYKVMCFNGDPRLIEVHQNRYTSSHTQDFYDTDWNKTSILQGPASGGVIEKPANFDIMLEFSRKLASGIPFLRVDWYEVQNQLLFGEITFYDGAGFEAFDKYEDDLLLGSWIHLSLNDQE